MHAQQSRVKKNSVSYGKGEEFDPVDNIASPRNDFASYCGALKYKTTVREGCGRGDVSSSPSSAHTPYNDLVPKLHKPRIDVNNILNESFTCFPCNNDDNYLITSSERLINKSLRISEDQSSFELNAGTTPLDTIQQYGEHNCYNKKEIKLSSTSACNDNSMSSSETLKELRQRLQKEKYELENLRHLVKQKKKELHYLKHESFNEVYPIVFNAHTISKLQHLNNYTWNNIDQKTLDECWTNPNDQCSDSHHCISEGVVRLESCTEQQIKKSGILEIVVLQIEGFAYNPKTNPSCRVATVEARIVMGHPKPDDANFNLHQQTLCQHVNQQELLDMNYHQRHHCHFHNNNCDLFRVVIEGNILQNGESQFPDTPLKFDLRTVKNINSLFLILIVYYQYNVTMNHKTIVNNDVKHPVGWVWVNLKLLTNSVASLRLPNAMILSSLPKHMMLNQTNDIPIFSEGCAHTNKETLYQLITNIRFIKTSSQIMIDEPFQRTCSNELNQLSSIELLRGTNTILGHTHGRVRGLRTRSHILCPSLTSFQSNYTIDKKDEAIDTSDLYHVNEERLPTDTSFITPGIHHFHCVKCGEVPTTHLLCHRWVPISKGGPKCSICHYHAQQMYYSNLRKTTHLKRNPLSPTFSVLPTPQSNSSQSVGRTDNITTVVDMEEEKKKELLPLTVSDVNHDPIAHMICLHILSCEQLNPLLDELPYSIVVSVSLGRFLDQSVSPSKIMTDQPILTCQTKRFSIDPSLVHQNSSLIIQCDQWVKLSLLKNDVRALGLRNAGEVELCLEIIQKKNVQHSKDVNFGTPFICSLKKMVSTLGIGTCTISSPILNLSANFGWTIVLKMGIESPLNDTHHIE